MSLRPPSSQKQYDDYASIDTAFRQPPSAPADDCTADQRKQYDEALADYTAKLQAAKDTGDWSALRVEGQTPTKFVLGQIDRNIWRAILDRATLPNSNPRWIGSATLLNILFRLALKSIVGWDIKVERRSDPDWEDWEMAQPELVTMLDEIRPSIVSEIGGGVYKRLQSISPRP